MHAASIEVQGKLAVEPEAYGGPVAGVGYEQEFVVGEAVEDGVVIDATPFVADEAVAGPPYAQVRRGAGEQNIQQTGRVGAANVQSAHVGDVEQAGRVAYRRHLGDNSLVLHRHVPSAEGHHAGAKGYVGIVKRGAEIFSNGGISSHRLFERGCDASETLRIIIPPRPLRRNDEKARYAYPVCHRKERGDVAISLTERCPLLRLDCSATLAMTGGGKWYPWGIKAR